MIIENEISMKTYELTNQYDRQEFLHRNPKGKDEHEVDHHSLLEEAVVF